MSLFASARCRDEFTARRGEFSNAGIFILHIRRSRRPDPPAGLRARRQAAFLTIKPRMIFMHNGERVAHLYRDFKFNTLDSESLWARGRF